MSKISEINYGTDIVFKYLVKGITDRRLALKWIANVIIEGKIDIHKVEAEDFLNYHDGTKTKNIKAIDSIDKFVKEYEETNYKAINITATVAGMPFLIGINLDTQIIILSYQTKYNLQYEYLEKLLKL